MAELVADVELAACQAGQGGAVDQPVSLDGGPAQDGQRAGPGGTGAAGG